jgi:hypothetical protein
MRLSALLVMLLCMKVSFAQTLTETYPKTLWCPNDTISMKFSNLRERDHYQVSTLKTSYGGDATYGLGITLYFGKDSLRLNYHNKIPYAHYISVNLASPKGKSTLKLHFNDLQVMFPKSYIMRNTGNVQFDIPEPYELANILWTISPAGQKATDLNKEGAYYERVMKWFKPYMNDPIFKLLDFPDSIATGNYYDFRENSFAFNFQDTMLGSKHTALTFDGPYYHVFGTELADSSLFGKLKPAVENFAARSGFRQFYKANLKFYQEQLSRQRELLPVKQMWTWLERNFPKIAYHSYKVVSSPLIGGTHSTQRYTTYVDDKRFAENVMFVCGTDRYDRNVDLTEKQRAGLMSGIVFTEIDHNYVNPTSNKYASQINAAFGKRQGWVREDAYNVSYTSPVAVFNEYMTHALFCLYISDVYDKETADFIIAERVKLMVERRKFVHFARFNEELMRLHNLDQSRAAADLYTEILAWCNTQI